MKYKHLLLILLLATQAGFAQISGPTTGTVGVPVTFSSMKSGTDYNWSFGTSSRNVDPSNYNPAAVSLGAIGISKPSSAHMVFDGTNWYCFFVTLNSGEIRRVDYGNNPTNTTPSFATLSTALPGSTTHHLVVVYDSIAGRWFGIATTQNQSGLIKLDFGAVGLTNPSPMMTIIPTNPSIGAGMGQLILVRDNGIWHCIQSSWSSAGGQAYYNLGASLGTLSASTTVTRVAQGGNDQNLSLYKEGQEWFGIASVDNTNVLHRYEFGTSLQNVPNIVNVSMPGFTYLIRGCFFLVPGCDDQLYGYIFSSGTTITKLSFGNSIKNQPTYTTLSGTGFSPGDPAFNIPAPFVYNDTLYMAFGNFNAATLHTARLMPLTGSTTTHHSSSVTHTFNAPGTYTVNLLVDPARPSGSSSYCAQITITAAGGPAQPGPFTAAPSPVCQDQNNVTYTVPSVSGATSYEWSYTGGSGVTFGNASTTTPTNTVSFSTSASSGTLRVRAVNGGGNSAYRDTAIVVNGTPATPGTFTTAPSPVCQGQNSVAYEVPAVSGGTSYEWSYASGTGVTFGNASTTTPTNTVSFSASATSGSIQVAAKNSCGTSSARSTAVTVNPLPAQPGTFTAAISPVCNGQSNVAYTVPNVSGITYTWSYTGGTGVTINGSGNSVTADFNSTATSGVMEVTATNSCGTSAARTTSVTVNPLPQATVSPAGPVDICADDSVTLTAGSGTGYTYEWKEGATLVGQGPVYKAGTSGSYKVIVTSANCSDSTDAVLVTHYSLPTVTITPGDTSFCAGEMVTLHVMTSDTGLSYTWKDGAATITAATAAFLQVSVSGSYSVIAERTGMTGCADSSYPAIVTVFPLPVPDINWDGEHLYTSEEYALYHWLNGAGDTMTGANSSRYQPLVNGTYLVSVTDSNGCSGMSVPYHVNNVHIGQIAARSAAINIYPNPVTSMINIDAPEMISVSVCSMEGKEIIQVRNIQNAAIDLSHLSDGLYILRIQDRAGKWIKNEKLIKKSGL